MASQGLFDRGCACWRRGVPSREGPALVSPAIQTKFPGRGSHLAPSGNSAGRNLSPSVRRAVAPAGERTCGPAPAPCFLFIRHGRNDLKVLVAECFAGKLLPKQPRVARGLWRGGRRVPLVRACDVGGRPWPRCPREAHWENFHRGNRWRGSFGWVEENNEPAFPGSRVPDLGCPCEACEYRSSHLSSPANLPPHRLFP